MLSIPKHPLKILVIGSGGREHALVWKLSQSPLVKQIFCAPGNGGTAIENKSKNVDIKIDEFSKLAQFCLDEQIDLTVVGPENALAIGIVDYFTEKGLRIFGPTKAAAQLEWSKSYAKQFMAKYNLPTAKFTTCRTYKEASMLIETNSWAQVIKADGLASGKGVYVCNNKEEAKQALKEIFEENKFGQAAETIVLEEKLSGEELSLFLLCDGKTFLPLAPSQDFKRRFENNCGPNTGGMGAISPPPIYDKYKNTVEETIFNPLMKALKAEGISYQGLLYIGVLLDQEKDTSKIQPKIIEFNSRFGDPETQAVLLRLQSDLLPALWACTEGKLEEVDLVWTHEHSCCVIAVNKDYPEKSSKGKPITLPKATNNNVVAFHAGTQIVDNIPVTSGGRILAVTAIAPDLDQAANNAYEYLASLKFESIDYRKDIGRIKAKYINMTQQISNETKTRIVALNHADIAKLSLPFLAIVVPKEFKKQDLLALPAYWLQPKDISSPLIKNNELPASVINILTEVLTESLLEDLWVSFTDNLLPWQKQWQQIGFTQWAEKQFLPGVTDNLAHVVEEALGLQNMPLQFKVASGTIYLANKSETFLQPEYRLYHPVVERFQTHDLSSVNNAVYFPFPTVILDKPPAPEIVSLDVSNEELLSISKNRVLALSLEEMEAIKDYYASSKIKTERAKANLSLWPTDAELEVIAQTWSEHCKHKIFNANITMQDDNDSTNISTIKSLYKSYIQKATKELQDKRKDLLSVFKDNSGVVKWNDKVAICFKVETHNSPSALEPYGGALTGILGVNRDILGTGLGAKPIFNTDILCFAYPSKDLPKRPKLLPPEVIMEGVRKGIQDGGNKSGIPTVNGAIVFNPKYRAKPLVFCGTGGIMPLEVAGVCAYEKHTQTGDTIVMAGGRVGKDGIHGATFSSEALHEGSPVTAVQIGDPFTQKRLLDFVLAARDAGLITGLTDNGAGGLSSSVGEMATITGGASIDLDHIPTKYPGLCAWEIIVSESQERMTLSTNNYPALETLAKKFNVEVSAIGEFNTSGKFEVSHQGKTIISLDLDFLHDGVPELQLEANWQKFSEPKIDTKLVGHEKTDLHTLLLNVLSHPNVCSREAVIRQYDHEVQGTSVIKPLMGKNQSAPCDAAVIAPVLGEIAGLTISNGICSQLSEFDPFLMAQSALDEAIRNAVCVGVDPASISVLDNFCWPDPVASANNPEGKKYLGMLVKACQGLYEAAVAMETPLISGKDSMKNDFDDGVVRLSVPPTLLISAIGKVPNIDNCITSEFKNSGDLIFLLSAGTFGLAGSVIADILSSPVILSSLDVLLAKELYSRLYKAINKKLIKSAHDISEGGLMTNISESIIGSNLGADIDMQAIQEAAAYAPLIHKLKDVSSDLLPLLLFFAEGPAQIIVTVSANDKEDFLQLMKGQNVSPLGQVTNTNALEIKIKTKENKWQASELLNAWSTPLPFN